jgi:hypothetical protein
MVVTTGKFFGEIVDFTCDGDCSRAWGINWTKQKTELAPEDPGTYEGGHGKPLPPYPPEKHNKWCVRECERSDTVAGGNT